MLVLIGHIATRQHGDDKYIASQHYLQQDLVQDHSVSVADIACRLGRGSTPTGVADDYKSAALLQRAEEGDSNAVHPQRIPSHVKPVMRDADSKNWEPKDRPGTGAKDARAGDDEYEGLV